MSETSQASGGRSKKKILLGCAIAPFALTALMALIGVLFLSGQWHVERTTVIGAEPAAVFELVDRAEGWAAWTDWAKEEDPTHSITPKEIGRAHV